MAHVGRLECREALSREGVSTAAAIPFIEMTSGQSDTHALRLHLYFGSFATHSLYRG